MTTIVIINATNTINAINITKARFFAIAIIATIPVLATPLPAAHYYALITASYGITTVFWGHIIRHYYGAHHFGFGIMNR